MDHLERRLAAHLNERAAHIQLDDPGVHVVTTMGKRRKRRTAMLAGVGFAAVAAVGVGTLGLLALRNDKGVGTVKAPAADESAGAQVPFGPDIEAATEVEPTLQWTVEPLDPEDRLSSNATGGGLPAANESVYALGTAPGEVDQLGRWPQQLIRTTDGSDATRVGEPFDPWITDLDGTNPDVAYAIGTAPNAQTELGYDISIGRFDSSGALTRSTLPFDGQALFDDLGARGLNNVQIEEHDGAVIALVQVSAWGGALQIDGVDTQWGTRIVDDGVDVFGPVTDLVAAAEGVCPDGWPLAEGPPRPSEIPEGSEPPQPTVVAGLEGKVYHCESPDRSVDDLWIDQSQVTGPVTQTLSFEELGFAPETIAALRGSPVLYRSTDQGTTWQVVDAELPGVDPRLGAAAQLTSFAGGFAVFMPTLLETNLAVSGDGLTWSIAAPIGDVRQATAVSLPNGSLMVLGLTGVTLVAHSTVDGTSWTSRDVSAILDLPADWRVSSWQAVGGSTGTAVVLNVAVDAIARDGTFAIEHDRFTLRQLDGVGNFELIDSDGVSLDRLTYNWAPSPASPNGLMVGTASGIDALDTSGNVVDTFTTAEIGQLPDSHQDIWNDPANQARQLLLLDTQDGISWSVTPASEFGISAQASAMSWFSAPGGLVFDITVWNANGGTNLRLLGRRAV